MFPSLARLEAPERPVESTHADNVARRSHVGGVRTGDGARERLGGCREAAVRNEGIRKRRTLFWFACVPTRVLVAVGAAVLSTVSVDATRVAGGAAFLVAFGFVAAYAVDAPTGRFGGPVWWSRARLGHAAMYAVFGACAVAGLRTAWIVLLLDVVGGVAWYVRWSPREATECVGAEGRVPPSSNRAGLIRTGTLD